MQRTIALLNVLLNVLHAPLLAAGTWQGLGVAGAGLASSLAIAAGVVLLGFYFGRLEKYVSFHGEQWRPRFDTWKRMLKIGFPAGAEFMLMFVFLGVIYGIIRDFGTAAQAGFSVGSRVMQAIFLPAMAIAFATAPIAGQNFGAKQPARVRETFVAAALMSSMLMLLLTLMCQWRPQWFIRFFTTDAAVIAAGALYLRIISWNFVASGLVFTCSGMFQAMGNTWPSLISTGSRLLTFILPAIWLSRQPSFRIEQVWHLSVVTVALQAITSLVLVRMQLRSRMREMA